jgi:hypothetical protein
MNRQQARVRWSWVTTAGLIAATTGTLLMMSWVILPNAASADPLGNNGTIKVDGIEFDSHPDNEPHVGCTFQIDFYGYDHGDLFADVTFESQAPTDPSNAALLTDEVFIGEDDNSGAGSEAGLDASATYTLDFTGLTPHDIQGFHVKLTIHADGSQGEDVKYKVFWVTGCGTTTTTTTTTPTTTTTTSPAQTTTTSPAGTTTTTTQSPTVSPTSTKSTTSKTTTAVVAPTTVRPGGTAFTGVEDVVPLGAIALALMTGGSGLLWAGSRRRRDGDEADD